MFDKYEGFETSTLYPGYSADFFDTHHNVVVRGLGFWAVAATLLMALVQRLGDRTRRCHVLRNAARSAIGTNVTIRTRGSVADLRTM